MQRGGGEQEFAGIFGGPANSLANLIAGPVRVAKFMGFINHHHIPCGGLEVIANPVGEVERHNQHGLLGEWGLAQLLGVTKTTGVQHQGRQVELFREFQRPLLAERCWANHQQLAFAFGPELAKDNPRLNGFAQAYFIGQDHSLRQWRVKREQGRLDLMRVQIDCRIEERHRQAV